MQAFGQSNRGTPPRPPQPSPLQPIMLMRSPVVNDRVLAAKDSRVQRLLDTYKDNGKVVEEMFLATHRPRAVDPKEKRAGRFGRQEPRGRRAERAVGAAQPGGVSL